MTFVNLGSPDAEARFSQSDVAVTPEVQTLLNRMSQSDTKEVDL